MYRKLLLGLTAVAAIAFVGGGEASARGAMATVHHSRMHRGGFNHGGFRHGYYGRGWYAPRYSSVGFYQPHYLSARSDCYRTEWIGGPRHRRVRRVYVCG